jgi:hypothetical protein
MNIQQLLKQATNASGNIDINHYTNLVLLEACRLVKETPITCAYTTFDEQVAITQRAECFKQIYNQIAENLNGTTT